VNITPPGFLIDSADITGGNVLKEHDGTSGADKY
jgi:hypothetical protein